MPFPRIRSHEAKATIHHLTNHAFSNEYGIFLKCLSLLSRICGMGIGHGIVTVIAEFAAFCKGVPVNLSNSALNNAEGLRNGHPFGP